MKHNKTAVAFCIPNMVIGGVEFVFIRTLAELLKHKDLEISVMFSSPLTEPVFIEWFNAHPQIKTYVVFPLCQKFEALKDKCDFFPLKQLRKLVFSFYKNIKRFQLAHSAFIKKQDIIIDYASFGFIKELRHIKKPKFTWVHCSINYFNDHKFYPMTKHYDKLVVLSDSIRQDLTKQYPDLEHKLVHIYNPINTDEILAKLDKATIPDGKYFTCVSRLDYDKDIPTLINAFNIFWMGAGQPDVKLYIVGGGPKEKEFKTLAAGTDAKNNIIFTGAQPNPFGYMSGAMAHILSSYNEGLPTVLIEAATVGTLNISSDCKSGPREILLNGHGGLLFEPGNVDALAQVMSDVWHKQIDTRTLISNMTNSLKRFEPKSIASQIVKLVNTVK
ncbi:MAG: glycosyltransferase [Alphaproteobacteria bacterium]|nr:glycosyltransferase [Alphaproteobacteria bacterium]